MLKRRSFLVVAASAFPLGCVRRREPEYVGLSSDYVDDALGPEMRRVSVTMYMTQWCPHCRHARQWLTQGGYSFEMHDVDEDDAAADILEDINPRGGVPTFVIDGEVVFGFEAHRLKQAIRRAAEERVQTGHHSP